MLPGPALAAPLKSQKPLHNSPRSENCDQIATKYINKVLKFAACGFLGFAHAGIPVKTNL